MRVITGSSPFGSETRTRTLILLGLVGSSFPRELARLLEKPLSLVQKALAGLERDGLVAAQTLGRMRVYRVNPRYFARLELDAYLGKLTAAHPDLQARAATVRRRPRATGKPL